MATRCHIPIPPSTALCPFLASFLPYTPLNPRGPSGLSVHGPTLPAFLQGCPFILPAVLEELVFPGLCTGCHCSGCPGSMQSLQTRSVSPGGSSAPTGLLRGLHISAQPWPSRTCRDPPWLLPARLTCAPSLSPDSISLSLRRSGCPLPLPQPQPTHVSHFATARVPSCPLQGVLKLQTAPSSKPSKHSWSLPCSAFPPGLGWSLQAFLLPSLPLSCLELPLVSQTGHDPVPRGP